MVVCGGAMTAQSFWSRGEANAWGVYLCERPLLVGFLKTDESNQT